MTTDSAGAGTSEGADDKDTGTGTTPEPSAALGEIASGLVSNMPEVQPHAVAQARAEQEESDNAPTDKDGTRFDPSIHAVGPDGKGIIGARGTWNKKRGRGSAAAKANAATAGPSRMAGSESVPGAPVPNAAQVQRENEAKIAGQAAAQMLFMAGQALGGSEWAPREGEPDLIAGAFSEYFKAKNIRDIPPGAALAFALCIYAGPRFAMPETKRRVSSLWGRVKLWIANRKLKKHGMRAVHEKDADGNGGK